MTRSVLYPISDHCDGRRFFNPNGSAPLGFREVLRWKRTSHASPWPKQVALSPQPFHSQVPAAGSVALTWINHASFLLQSSRGNFLIDPVYGERCGPRGFLGPKRVHAPGIPFKALPF